MPQVREGGAAWPSLFVFGAGLLLWAASLLAGEAYRWGAIALLVLACAPWHALPRNPLTAIVALFCAWQLVNAWFVTPGYQAEGVYRPMILFCAFAAFAALGRDAALRMFRAGVALLAILVLLGLLQHFFGFWHLSHNALRAAATFRTPNTFATAINLFLLPAAVLYLTGNGSARIYWLALWLFAGLVATQSRGGMLALFISLAFVAACLGRWSALRQTARPAARLLMGGVAVWIFVVAAGGMLMPVSRGTDVEAPSADAWVGRTIWDRAEIYATTLELIRERPLAGAGANMFRPLFEPVTAEGFGEHTFNFAHSDYLQIWLEYGALGLALFLALAAAALAFARSAHRRAPADPMPLACGAALASCLAHAAVDFPFYVPFTLFIAGGYLGALAAAAGDSLRGGLWSGVEARAGRLMTPAVRWAAVLALLAWLAQPMLAELAGDRAVEVMSHGNVQGGLYWQSVARRLEPRKPSHYWAEAVIWRELAIESGDRAYWAKADALLADGIRANPPFSFLVRLERARLHRRFSQNLEHAAAPAEVLSWVEEALAGAPGSFEGQVELVRALDYAGRRGEATRMSRGLLERRPDSPLARRLVEEMR